MHFCFSIIDVYHFHHKVVKKPTKIVTPIYVNTWQGIVRHYKSNIQLKHMHWLPKDFQRWHQILIHFHYHNYITCRNPSFGLATKGRACKGAGQKWSLGITFHAPGSVGKREGLNPHTPKWTPTLGIGVLVDFQIFKGWLQGSKFIGLKSYLYHWIFFGT